jgi:hypothetical protein
MGYAGLATIEGRDTVLWVRELLRGEQRTILEHLELLEQALTRSIGPSAAAHGIVHGFVFAGWEEGLPLIGAISNIPPSQPNEPIRPAFARYAANQDQGGLFMAAGAGVKAISAADLDLLSRFARRRPSSPEDLDQVLADVNKRAKELGHPASETISLASATAHMGPPGPRRQPGIPNQPVSTRIHYWDEATMGVPPAGGMLLSGIDLTEMLNVMAGLDPAQPFDEQEHRRRIDQALKDATKQREP